jgi:Tat protein translocase TatB subunit
MLDIGWSELLVIGVVALIVVGPKDLPKMFRTLGQATGKARAMAREFQRAMDDAANDSGVKDVARDLREATSGKSMGLDGVGDAVRPQGPEEVGSVETGGEEAAEGGRARPGGTGGRGETRPWPRHGEAGRGSGRANRGDARCSGCPPRQGRRESGREGRSPGSRSGGASAPWGAGRQRKARRMKGDDIDDSSAPLIEHLAELRTRLIRSALAFVRGDGNRCFTVAEPILNFLVRTDCRGAAQPRGEDPRLIFTAPQEKFFVLIRISVVGGLALSFPVIAHQLWRFIAPGLYRSERNAFLPFMIWPLRCCSLIGAAFAHYVVTPLAMNFFIGFRGHRCRRSPPC